jgi:hypothetical protein
MPKVKGKHYPYTKEGIAAADKARRGYKPGGRVVSPITRLRNAVSAEVFRKWAEKPKKK